ncbi:MAG: hypothetical protein HOP02_11695 [Methylococcaceae bacterium]|nr:hypothetical protein [Methylococcaceae bacterium]
MNNQQRGLTLVELMLSMVISLGLIAGISSLFLQMQKSNKVQRGLSAMSDDSSYVQEVLQKEMRNTGRLRSRSDSSGTNNSVFLNPAGNEFDSTIDLLSGEYIKGVRDAVTNNDEFVIRYQLLDDQDLSSDPLIATNGSSPCTQNILMQPTDVVPITLNPAGDPASEVHIVNVYFYLSGNKLMCQAQRQKVTAVAAGPFLGASQCLKNCATEGSATDFTPAATPGPVEIIGNVVKLVLAYGVDSDVTPDQAANYYVSAAQVPAGRWRNVVSVRMTVVVRSEETFIRDTADAYKLDGSPLTPSDDKHQLYKVFTTTIALRNQLM